MKSSKMKRVIWCAFTFFLSVGLFAQNSNVSNGTIFDGEPYLSIDPSNAQHMVVAWMGYLPFTNIFIKTKVSFNGGQSWSETVTIPHVDPAYGSADPTLVFDTEGTVLLSYIDFSAALFSGAVYVVKSDDGGLSWQTPVEVINMDDDEGYFPVDRPWMSIDQSGGVNNGNIYVTTMPPGLFGPLAPPFHPYFVVSTDGGETFDAWQYLDAPDWLAGNLIQQPMPTNCVSSNGAFHAVYPSFLFAQGLLPQYIIASTTDEGGSFNYSSVYSSINTIQSEDAKKGYLLRDNPDDPNHLAFFYLDTPHGDIDVFIKESFDEGLTWNESTRVNDDPIANNRMQDLVWADFDTDGDLMVSWRDRRNALDSTFATTTEIWGAYRNKDSTDFAPNFPLSDTSVPHDTVLTFAGNDFMCIKFRDDTLSAVWGDTRNGKLNIWFQRQLPDGTVLSTEEIASGKVPQVRVFPNPLNAVLNIEGQEIERIQVVDQRGALVATAENKTHSEVIFIDSSKWPSGVYFVRTSTAQGISTEKVIKPL